MLDWAERGETERVDWEVLVFRPIWRPISNIVQILTQFFDFFQIFHSMSAISDAIF